MKITFNAQGTGYGDNGGTATLFHSANILHWLGHEVRVVTDVENRFTWFKLDGPEFIRTYKDDYPDADVLMATGCSSVKRVLQASKTKGTKVWWVRAHETWIMKGEDLKSLYLNPNVRKMVNSNCLRKFFNKKMKLLFPVVRPGMDLDVFYRTKERRWEEKDEFVIGTLYSEKATKRFKWISGICKGLKKRKVKFRLRFFGTYEAPVGIKYDQYLYKPSQDGLRDFYNDVDFWIAPSRAEGLHIPPQEAILCGCILLGASGELNGMYDYLDNGVTGYTIDSPDRAVDLISGFFHKKEKRERLLDMSEKAINRVKCLGDRKSNMVRMVDLFRRMIGKDERRSTLALRRERR